MSYDLKRLRAMSGKVAVVGIGETDYGKDYRAARQARERGVPGELDSHGLAARAFKRALEDSGLRKEDIDGVATGGPIVNEHMCDILGINPIWDDHGSGAGLLLMATQAITSGMCSTVALIYGNAQRSMGTQYGGSTIGENQATSYYYFHPWGWSSQGAHVAMMTKYYQLKYGATEEQLGTVAVTFRKHAVLNENAVMRTPLTIQDYLNSRYICRPLRLYDYCLVNDGGVALILRRADLAKDLPHTPVLISGLGKASAGINHAQLRDWILDLNYSLVKASGDQAFGMAQMTLKDIDHFQTYDAFSMSLPMSLEGLGFCKRGEALDFIQGGRIGLGGELPCNTSGGMMSESYMQSWNHQVEAVRQLRHEAGQRQVKDVEASMFVWPYSGPGYSIIYRRKS